MASRCCLNRGGWGGVRQVRVRVSDSGSLRVGERGAGVGEGRSLALVHPRMRTSTALPWKTLGETPPTHKGHFHAESCLGQVWRVRFGTVTLTLVMPRFEA